MCADEMLKAAGYKLSNWTDEDYIIYQNENLEIEVGFVLQEQRVSIIRIPEDLDLYFGSLLNIDDLEKDAQIAINAKAKELGFNK